MLLNYYLNVSASCICASATDESHFDESLVWRIIFRHWFQCTFYFHFYYIIFTHSLYINCWVSSLCTYTITFFQNVLLSIVLKCIVNYETTVGSAWIWDGKDYIGIHRVFIKNLTNLKVIDIRGCGMIANETTFHPSHSL